VDILLPRKFTACAGIDEESDVCIVKSYVQKIEHSADQLT
jgi:hypothetical protein